MGVGPNPLYLQMHEIRIQENLNSTIWRIPTISFFVAVSLLFYREFTFTILKLSDIFIILASCITIPFVLIKFKEHIVLPTYPSLALLAFIIINMISIFISPVSFDIQSLLEVGRYVIAGALFLTTFFLLIYGVVSAENTYTILSLAPLPSALGSIFAFFFSILGIQIPLLDVFLFSRGISIRASAFIFDPNYYANLLLIPLTITGYRTFVQGYNKRSNGILFSVYSLAIFSTVSRSGLGAMTFVLVALIILYLLQEEIVKKNHLMIGLSGSLFALLLIGPQLIRKVGLGPLRSGGSIYRSLLLRATLWRQGIEVWSHRPLFGVGLGNYLEYLHTLPAHEVERLQYTHNTILTPLASVGLLGMIPIVILILSHFRSSLSISKENKHAANIASTTVIAILLQGMFIEVLPARWLWLFLAIPIGLAVRERMLERGQMEVKL